MKKQDQQKQEIENVLMYQAFEFIATQGDWRLDDILQTCEFAFADYLEKRPSVAKDVIRALGFISQCTTGLARNYDFANKWLAEYSEKEKLKIAQ
jgi:hypothetical protein